MRQPIRCGRTGLWLARYRTPDGKVRQAGKFARKGDAQKAIAAALEAREREAARASDPTVAEFLERWPETFPRHPRTTQTNLDRIAAYVLPHLPGGGDLPLRELRRPVLRQVQAALLRRGLAKTTIDGAFASLSAMLTDAVDDELIDGNPARGFRVRPNDPRLQPAREPRDRRAVAPEEVGAFIAALDPRWRAVCWAPFLTGARPGELFAIRREEIDRRRCLVYLHETVDRYGHVERGLKTTHHIADRERRGRWTLFPPALQALVDELPAPPDDWAFGTTRGRTWSQRNFYRDVWKPAKEASGTGLRTVRRAPHVLLATAGRRNPARRGRRLDGPLAARRGIGGQHDLAHLRARDGRAPGGGAAGARRVRRAGGWRRWGRKGAGRERCVSTELVKSMPASAPRLRSAAGAARVARVAARAVMKVTTHEPAATGRRRIGERRARILWLGRWAGVIGVVEQTVQQGPRVHEHSPHPLTAHLQERGDLPIGVALSAEADGAALQFGQRRERRCKREAVAHRLGGVTAAHRHRVQHAPGDAITALAVKDAEVGRQPLATSGRPASGPQRVKRAAAQRALEIGQSPLGRARPLTPFRPHPQQRFLDDGFPIDCRLGAEHPCDVGVDQRLMSGHERGEVRALIGLGLCVTGARRRGNDVPTTGARGGNGEGLTFRESLLVTLESELAGMVLQAAHAAYGAAHATPRQVAGRTDNMARPDTSPSGVRLPDSAPCRAYPVGRRRIAPTHGVPAAPAVVHGRAGQWSTNGGARLVPTSSAAPPARCAAPYDGVSRYAKAQAK
jgi:integrase